MRWTLAGLAAIAVVCGAIVAQDWRAWVRFTRQPPDIAQPDVSMWFDTKAAVGTGPGAEVPVAPASDRALPADVLEAAWTYADSLGTGAMVVLHDGVIQFERYGEGVRRETMYQSQSLHKGLTAIALGAAIQRGAIESEDTLASTYLTEWANRPRAEDATLADLAYMQAGLERLEFKLWPTSPGLKLFISGDVSRVTLETPFVAAPREKFIWANSSTQALGIAISRAVRKPWNEFIAEAIWSPIGAGEAYVQVDRPGGTTTTFCCFISNALNWARVGQLLLDDGTVGDRRVLPPGWVRKMTTGGARNPNYGMQLWINEPVLDEVLRNEVPRVVQPRKERMAAADAFYIEGHFAQRLYVVPSADLVVVRLGDDTLEWDDATFMNGMIRAIQARDARAALPTPPSVAGPFDPGAVPPAPDYSRLDHWAAHPDKRDLSDYRPGGSLAGPARTSVAAFYVNPTTYRGPNWNASVDDAESNRAVDAVVAGQASVLNECCVVYAPRYRQAGAAALVDRSGSGARAQALAYEDVRKAFETFIEVADGRPYVLMGHSQGDFHLQRLIREVIVGTPLASRLVAAYLVGIPLPEREIRERWAPFTLCERQDQTGCILTWSTFGPQADARVFAASMVQRYPRDARGGRVEIACTNPLTGSSAATAAASANVGALPPPVPGAYLAEPVPNVVGARCEDGMLRVDRAPPAPFDAWALPGDNYHFYDVALFYDNLRADATRRAQAFATR